MPTEAELWSLLESGRKLHFSSPPDYPGAIAIFREVAELAPQWSEPHFWLSAALAQAGDLPQALTEAKKATDLNAQDPRHWIHLGSVLVKLRHWKEATRALEKGISLRPHYGEADARCLLADAFEASGRCKDAEEQWRVILSMEPTYPSYEKPMEEARKRLQGKPRRRRR